MLSNWLQRILCRRPAASLFSFIALTLALLAWLSMPALAQDADANAYVTADLNLRAGPDTDYPAIIVIPAGQYVTVYDCIPDLTWCDVSFGENRGWAAAEYIQAFYQGQYMTVQQYAPQVSLPTAAFEIRTYWNSYYTGQPFYDQLDTWASPRPAVRTNSFYEPLSSYGDWVQVQDQYVWVPHGVDHDWRPYTHGHWENTDQGWFWASSEPYGWATYHYGRWGYSHDVGWFWVPGTVWAPAWVAWRGSDSYLGWAPLPPAPDAGLTVSVGIGAVPNYYWSVVPAQSFLSVNIGAALVAPVAFGAVFAQTQPLGSTTIVNNVVVNKTVNINYVEQKTGQKVVVQKLAAAGAGGPGAAGKLAVFTPPPAGQGLKKPPKLKKVEEIAAVSQTKGQAGNEKALDLTTTRKLKGPPPGKTLGAGTPPPPPPPGGGGKGQNANKVVACTGGKEHRPPPNGPCECPPGKKEVNGACENPGKEAGPAACTGGKEHRPPPNGPCECPPGKKEVNGACENPAKEAGPAACTGGKEHRPPPNGPCACPPGKKEVNGACENPAKEARPAACGGGKEHTPPPNGPCECPPGKRDVGGVCENPPAKENKPAQLKTVSCPPNEHPQGAGCVPNAPPKGAGGPPPGGGGNGGKPPACPPPKHLGPDNKCH